MTNADTVLAAIKFCLYLGLVFEVGAGSFARWISRFDAPDTPQKVTRAVERLLSRVLMIGLGLVASVSLLDVLQTTYRVFGSLDAQTAWAYLTQSRHGNISLARIGLAVALAGMGLGLAPSAKARDRLFDGVFHSLLALAVIVTVSMTGHSGAEGRVLPLIGDVLHVIGMTAWIAAVAGLAWMPIWKILPSETFNALTRVSTVGLGSVILLVLTGLYTSLLRFYGLEAVTATPYGQALIVKFFAIAPVLALAGLSRFYIMPNFERTRSDQWLRRFRRPMKLESILLVGVLIATGNLVSQPPPQPPATLKNPQEFKDNMGGWNAEGGFVPSPGGTNLEFKITDTKGDPPPNFTPEVTLNLLDHPMVPVRMKLNTLEPGKYQGNGSFWMGGRWEAIISLPDAQKLKVELRAR
jgi:putative copper export protein